MHQVEKGIRRMTKWTIAACCVAPLLIVASHAESKVKVERSIEEAVEKSDDYLAHKGLFISAAHHLLADFRCTREHLSENGGFTRSSSASSRYFTYCGDYRRIDLQMINDTEYSLMRKDEQPRNYTYNDDAAASQEQVAARIAELEERVRPIPASDFSANLEIYRQLLALDPNNERYQAKVSHYEAMDAEDEKKYATPVEEPINGSKRIQFCQAQITDWLTHNTSKKSIKETLKAPRSAKFSNYQTQFMKAERGRCDYLVTVNVDVQNSFGATIRNSVSVVVAINPRTKRGVGVVVR